MNIHTRLIADLTVVDIHGRFDNYVIPDVIKEISAAAKAEPAKVIINLQDVTFVDSTALATLMQGMKHCRQRRGDLFLCSMQRPVYQTFELTRLNKVFRIFTSEAQAITAFTS